MRSSSRSLSSTLAVLGLSQAVHCYVFTSFKSFSPSVSSHETRHMHRASRDQITMWSTGLVADTIPLEASQPITLVVPPLGHEQYSSVTKVHRIRRSGYSPVRKFTQPQEPQTPPLHQLFRSMTVDDLEHFLRQKKIPLPCSNSKVLLENMAIKYSNQPYRGLSLRRGDVLVC